MSDLDSADDFKKFAPDDDDVRPIDMPATAPQPAPPIHETQRNLLIPGTSIDLLEKFPALKQVTVAAGWDSRALDENFVDIDLSCFLLGRDEKTRVDEDFVFYNNPTDADSAVKHGGDSRTGAGDGDDEAIQVNFHAVPFDVLRLAFVLSIYDDSNEGKNFGMIRNAYVRMIDNSEGMEVFRLQIDDAAIAEHRAVIAVILNREGPKWIAEAPITTAGNLAALAKQYGIIVKEDVG